MYTKKFSKGGIVFKGVNYQVQKIFADFKVCFQEHNKILAVVGIQPNAVL